MRQKACSKSAARRAAVAGALACPHCVGGAERSAFASAVLMTALALSMPALFTYAQLKREAVQKQAFMADCGETFKAAYCDTIWRTTNHP